MHSLLLPHYNDFVLNIDGLKVVSASMFEEYCLVVCSGVHRGSMIASRLWGATGATSLQPTGAHRGVTHEPLQRSAVATGGRGSPHDGGEAAFSPGKSGIWSYTTPSRLWASSPIAAWHSSCWRPKNDYRPLCWPEMSSPCFFWSHGRAGRETPGNCLRCRLVFAFGHAV